MATAGAAEKSTRYQFSDGRRSAPKRREMVCGGVMLIRSHRLLTCSPSASPRVSQLRWPGLITYHMLQDSISPSILRVSSERTRFWLKFGARIGHSSTAQAVGEREAPDRQRRS